MSIFLGLLLRSPRHCGGEFWVSSGQPTLIEMLSSSESIVQRQLDICNAMGPIRVGEPGVIQNASFVVGPPMPDERRP